MFKFIGIVLSVLLASQAMAETVCGKVKSIAAETKVLDQNTGTTMTSTYMVIATDDRGSVFSPVYISGTALSLANTALTSNLQICVNNPPSNHADSVEIYNPYFKPLVQ